MMQFSANGSTFGGDVVECLATHLRDSQQPPIWLFIAAGMVMAVFVVRLVLIIPVNAGDFRYGGAYGFNGPFGGGGGCGGLGRG
jgi:hypothetical protein